MLTLFFALLLSFPVAKRVQPQNDTVTLIGVLGLLVLCMFNLSAGTFNPFIYFRF